MAGRGLCRAQRLADAAAHGDMVVLDEEGVVEAEAMVHRAAAAHRIFLEGAQARRRLARAADLRIGMGDERHIFRRQGRDARQAAHEVERDAFGGEDGARIA